MVKVLQLIDSDEYNKPTTGYIYEAIDRAELAIKEIGGTMKST